MAKVKQKRSEREPDSSGDLDASASAGKALATALECGALEAAVEAGKAAAFAGSDVRAAVKGVLGELEDVVVDHAEEAVFPRLSFEELHAAYRAGKSIAVMALPPYAGHYVGNGINITPDVAIYPIAQLFALDPSYSQELLADKRVRVRIVE